MSKCKILVKLADKKMRKITIAMIMLFALAHQSSAAEIFNGNKLAANIESVIDRFYNSDNAYYRGIGRRMYECSYIYKTAKSNNIPRLVSRNITDIEKQFIIASKALFDDNKNWDTLIKSASKTKIDTNKNNKKFVETIIYNCNMYVRSFQDPRDAIYETANPSPVF